MRSGGASGCDGESRRHNQPLCRGLRRADRLDRRRRQRCRQQHAADAARVNANVAAVVVLRRRRRAGGVAVADDRRRTGGRERRGAARRPAREQPAKRQRIGGHQRNQAPPQRPVGEMPVHVERFPFSGPEHRSAEQIPRPDDDARFAPACVVSATRTNARRQVCHEPRIGSSRGSEAALGALSWHAQADPLLYRDADGRVGARRSRAGSRRSPQHYSTRLEGGGPAARRQRPRLCLA